MKKMKKLLCLLLTVAMIFAIAAAATGCGGGNGGKSEARTDLTYRLKSEPTSLDNIEVNDLVAFTVLYQLYDTLIIYETDGTLAPGLAESWEYTDDEQKVLRFHLRDDVVFHNGEKMTADDVEYSLNRSIKAPKTTLVTSNMDYAKKVDDDTVDLYLKNPYAPIEYCIANAHTAIVSKKAFEEDPNFGRNPVGSGPYKFESWNAGDTITLTANEDYWRGSPNIKNVTFKIITDLNTAAVSIQNGEIDVMQDPSTTDRETLMNDEKLNYLETPQAGTFYIAFNQKNKYFKDEKVRQAVSLAIDRDEIVAGAFDGCVIGIDNPVPSSVFGYDSSITAPARDIEKAKRLLAEAGYADGFKVKMKTPDDDMFAKPTEIIQAQLAQIGIEVEVQKMERGVWMTEFYFNADYDLGIGSLIANYPDFDYEYIEYHSSQIGLNNYFLTDIKELDDLFDLARRSTDEKEREQAYSDIAQYILDHALTCPLFTPYNTLVVNADLQGPQANEISRYYIFDWSWK